MNAFKTMNTTFQFVRFTPDTEGGISVFQLFGSGAKEGFKSVFEVVSKEKVDERNCLLFGYLRADGQRIDEAVARMIPAENGVLSEQIYEMNLHSGPAILSKCTSVLQQAGGTERKEDWYFSRISQEGIMDEIQREALRHLIRIRSRRASAVFLSQFRGRLTAKIRECIKKLRAQHTAYETVHKKITKVFRRYPSGKALLDHPVVGIAGPPNVGKSTLLNCFSQQEKALVHAEPGTTRDIVRSRIALRGYTFRMLDSAGMRETEDQIEEEGMERAIESFSNADIVLWMESDDVENVVSPDLLPEVDVLRVVNKVDLREAPEYGQQEPDHYCISAEEGKGIKELVDCILEELNLLNPLPVDEPIPFLPDHRKVLSNTKEALEREEQERAISLLKTLIGKTSEKD